MLIELQTSIEHTILSIEFGHVCGVSAYERVAILATCTSSYTVHVIYIYTGRLLTTPSPAASGYCENGRMYINHANPEFACCVVPFVRVVM